MRTVTVARTSAARRASLLHRRATVITDDLDAAARCATAFDDARLVPVAELAETLASTDLSTTCLVLSGLSDLGGVLRRVLSAAPDDVQIVVDLDDGSGQRLLASDGADLRGTRSRGPVLLGQVRGLLLAADPDGVVELEPVHRWVHDDLRGSEPNDIGLTLATTLAESDALAHQLAASRADLTAQTALVQSLRDQLAEAARPTPRPATGSGLRQRLGGGTARLLAVALGLGVLVLIVVGVLAAVTEAGWVAWLSASASVLALGALGAVLWLLRRVAGLLRTTRAEAGQARKTTLDLAKQSRQAQQQAERAQRNQANRSATIERDLEVVSASAIDSARTLAALANGKDSQGRNRRASLDAAHQAQAVANLFAMADVTAPVPLMGGWAASPDVVLLLVQELLDRRPSLVVECGSGVSSLWLGLLIKQHGLPCRVVALEHDVSFARSTREVLRRHGVDDVVEVRDAPLTDVDLAGHPTAWYSREALHDLDGIGLLFVDGPPEATGPRVRYPAVPLLCASFADRVSIVLDDLVRSSEQEISLAWATEHPDLSLERVSLEKGAAVLRRG